MKLNPYIQFIFVLLIFGCSNIDKKEKDNSPLEFWEIKYFVNEFQKQTDVGYITNVNPIIGTFTNSKVVGNLLRVKMMIKENAVGIKLYEDGSSLAVKGTKQNPIEYAMSIKHNDENIEFLFRGINENDVVVIGNIISFNHQTTLINYLKKGGKFQFYLESKSDINKKIYRFDINDESHSGFLNIFEKLNK